MDADAIKGVAKSAHVFAAERRNRPADFARVLRAQERNKTAESEVVRTPAGDSSGPAETLGNRHKIPLGTISESMPTVSHLLVGHPRYGDDCWRIVHSEQNRLKPYKKIRTGTDIFMDPETQEIVWGEERDHLQPTVSKGKEPPAVHNAESKRHGKSDVSMAPKTPSDRALPGADALVKSRQPVLLGMITETIPTVSHLLVDHPQYGKKAWEIIHSQENRNKPYADIQPGTAVFLDRETQEISWSRKTVAVASMASGNGVSPHQNGELAGAQGQDPFSTQLAKAVEPYIGRPYDELDCYELVVRGLVGMGVRYHGTGGLLERLKDMAAQEGLPQNAYLNGEGLVEASGTKVYSRSFMGIRDAQVQADEVIGQLDSLLRKGFIVSFSTHTKGHTGIVSQRNGEWTYINSGRMDHDLAVGSESRHVGEERLNEEIRDWFELAAKRKESLKITVGRLDAEKLMTFRHDRSLGPEEA
jgi:hypothetical protein